MEFMKGRTWSIDMDAMPSIEITGRKAACMIMEGIFTTRRARMVHDYSRYNWHWIGVAISCE